MVVLSYAYMLFLHSLYRICRSVFPKQMCVFDYMIYSVIVDIFAHIYLYLCIQISVYVYLEDMKWQKAT